MEQKALVRYLRLVILGIGILGLFACFVVIPMYGLSLKSMYPEFSNRFWPWLIFLWLSAVPCFISLAFLWRVASNIGLDRSFSSENAGYLKQVSRLFAIDSAFFFLGNAALLLMNMSHPGIMLASLAIVFVGIAASVAAAVLSRLALKASDLQMQSDLTV